ncbi:hypothetical protein BW897_32035 [Bacillus cereus]|uniref:Uncharacterized protein n=1 Tax=Bacillus cereus TaxID=1396 RepID=A0A1S9T345_BACCE|nr:hypothetical protein BW897_32035 [Bacillus cereus]
MHNTQTLLMCQNVLRFGLPTGEGAPSKNEGVGGVFMWGLGKSSPAGLDRVQGLFFCHACAWLGVAKEPRRARPNEIWYNVLDQIIGVS